MALRVKKSAVLALIGFIAGVLSGIYQEGFLTEELKQELIAQVGSITVFYVVVGIQIAIFVFIAAIIGLTLSEKLNLNFNFECTKRYGLYGVLVGLFSAILISFSDKLFFTSIIGESTEEYKISIMFLLTGIFYGGIVEEILMRLFLVSLLIFIFVKISKRQRNNTIDMLAISIAAIAFGLLHLPLAIQTYDFSVLLVVRTLLLNGLPGFLFGYLYVKYDLKYAMIAHAFSHIFMQLVFFPILF